MGGKRSVKGTGARDNYDLDNYLLTGKKVTLFYRNELEVSLGI